MARENGLLLAEMMGAFRAIISDLSGYPDDNVFWANAASDVPVPPRPYISLQLLQPETPVRAADDRTFHAKPYYRIEILSVATGVQYDLTIVDTLYSYTAVGGDTVVDVRDELVTAAAADPNSTVTGTGTTTASIDIEGNTNGVNLPVVVDPTARMAVTRFRSALVTTICRPVTMTIEVMVFGRLGIGSPNNNTVTDPDTPGPEQMSAHMAGILLGGLLHKGKTRAMRDLGHIPKTVSSAEDLSSIFRDEYEDVSRLDVEVETTLSFATFDEVVTEMTATNESAQLPP